MVSDRGPAAREDDGFTLIELMIVVLIIAVLLAIAIPTFLGARTKANDRAVQSNLRSAHTIELVYYTDDQSFTDDPDLLGPLDSQIKWTNTLTDVALSTQIMYVELTTVNGSAAVVIGAKSDSGRCFWVRSIHDQNEPRFASNECLSTPDAASYSESW